LHQTSRSSPEEDRRSSGEEAEQGCQNFDSGAGFLAFLINESLASDKGLVLFGREWQTILFAIALDLQLVW